MSIPASKPLRQLAAALVFAAAGLSIALPFVSATLLTIVLGGGISQLLRLTGGGDLSTKLFRALSGLLYVGGGLWILVFPVSSEVSLTLLVGLLMAFEGVMELAAGAAAKVPARGLVIADGLVTAILGGLLIAEWPSDSLWVIGTLFGVALAFSGVNLLTAPDPSSLSAND
jgi:membrane protein HdeD